MRDFMLKLFNAIETKHMLVVLSSLIAALLSTRNDSELTPLHRGLNTVTGFFTASLTGLILLEIGWAPFASSGMAYLAGHIGNRAMNTLINTMKLAEVDPLGFAAKVIALIWAYIIPTKNNDNEGSK